MQLLETSRGKETEGLSEAGYRRITPAEAKARLQSCKVVGAMGYINSVPAMPFMLPYEWNVNELAEEIVRACVDYDIAATWNGAKTLALSIAKKLVKDSFNGGFTTFD